MLAESENPQAMAARRSVVAQGEHAEIEDDDGGRGDWVRVLEQPILVS
jgi:hypothetical protein